MKKTHFLLILIILFTGLFSCKSDKKEVPETNNREVTGGAALDTFIKPGDSLIQIVNPNAASRPDIGADMRGFNGAKDEKNLRSLLAFVFGPEWEPRAKVTAGDDQFVKITGESYVFKDDGTYIFTGSKGKVNGVWKGLMAEDQPVMLLVPGDEKMKTTEWIIHDLGRKQMVWAGTNSYGDNAIQIMLKQKGVD